MEHDQGVTQLHIRVYDKDTKRLIPALVRFRAADGQYLGFGNLADLPGWGQGASAVELGKGKNGLFAFRHGMAVWQGEATIVVGRAWAHRDIGGKGVVSSQIPAGRYQLEVTRGVEYDMFTQMIDLGPDQGRIDLDVSLKHSVDTRGYVSADFHVHHAPESSDAQLDASGQLKIAAVNGVDVMVSANHENVVDLRALAHRLWRHDMPAPVQTIAGAEHEASNAHFGVFPLQANLGAPVARPWPLDVLLADLHALPGKPLVVSYHPRLGWKAYMDAPYCGAWVHRDFSAPPPCPQAYDAIELLSAWQSCGSRMRDTTETWLALLSYNHFAAPLGNSDSHFASAMLPGYPRTWVRTGKEHTPVNVDRLIEAIRERRTIASTAPFVTLRSGRAAEGDFVTNTQPRVPISVRVQAANWVPVDELRLLVNGQIVKTWQLPRTGRALDFQVTDVLELPADDVFVTAETDSHTPLPPSLVGEYNTLPEYGLPKCAPRAGESPGMPAFSVTSAILIDRDGDHLFKGFRAARAAEM